MWEGCSGVGFNDGRVFHLLRARQPPASFVSAFELFWPNSPPQLMQDPNWLANTTDLDCKVWASCPLRSFHTGPVLTQQAGIQRCGVVTVCSQGSTVVHPVWRQTQIAWPNNWLVISTAMTVRGGFWCSGHATRERLSQSPCICWRYPRRRLSFAVRVPTPGNHGHELMEPDQPFLVEGLTMLQIFASPWSPIRSNGILELEAARASYGYP